MKLLKHILPASLLCCCVAAALTACSADDDLKGHVPSAPTIQVVSNDLLFTAPGGTSSVEVAVGSAALTATTDADWCMATVNGSVVTVSVQANGDFEGRTAILTLKAGEAVRQLPVQQLGMVLGSLPVSSRGVAVGGETFSYTIAHDLPMTVATDQSWLHATLEGERLTVSVDGNEGGHLRRGRVVTECAGIRDTLGIAQYDLENDILGSYYILGYFGGNTNQPTGSRFDVLSRNDSIMMRWANSSGRYDNTYIPLGFDRGSATLYIPSGFVLYQGSSVTDTGYFYDSNNTLCVSDRSGAALRLNYNPTSGYCEAKPTAYNWPGHTLYGFIIRQASPFTNTTVIQLTSIAFMRVGPEGTSLND